MKVEKLVGLIAAPFTPFDGKGEVNYQEIVKQANALIADGIVGAYICGTTGEGISCSVAERLEIMRIWSTAARGKLKLIAHVGALSVKDMEVLGKAAQKLSYDATSIVPPCYFKPANVAALTELCKKVAAFAPELPFYYYHTMNASVNLSMVEFLAYADGKIPNLAGIKFNHHNFYEYQNCLNFAAGKYDIVYGVDEFYAGALALGAKGFIGSTYNYSAELYRQIDCAFAAGDWERVKLLMHQVCQGVDFLVKFGGIAAGKAMMRLKNIDCGDPRLPLLSLNEGQKREIASAMKKIMDESTILVC